MLSISCLARLTRHVSGRVELQNVSARCLSPTPPPFLPIDYDFLSPPRPPGHLAQWFFRVFGSMHGGGPGSRPISMNDFGGPDRPLKLTYVSFPEPMLTVQARKTADCPAVFTIASASSRPILDGVVLCSQRVLLLHGDCYRGPVHSQRASECATHAGTSSLLSAL